MKLSIEDTISIVQETLKAKNVDEAVIKETVNQILKGAKEIKAELQGEKIPKTHKEFSGLVLETGGEKVLKGYVFQLDAGSEAHQLVEKVSAAAKEYNGTRKGQRRPVIAISQGIEEIPNKYFKAQGLQRKTKEAVYIIKTDNKLV